MIYTKRLGCHWLRSDAIMQRKMASRSLSPGSNELLATLISSRILSAVVIAAGLLLLSPVLTGLVNGQVLPINNFTTADGLAHNNITQIFQDGKGYLWLATGEGLSRFDGYTFRNYGRDDGLTASYINDVTADRHGQLWVAINEGGVARFVDQPAVDGADAGAKFVSYSISALPRAKNVGQIIFDSENRLWCATEGGIFRARNIEVADGDFEYVAPEGDRNASREAFVDSRGRLWFGLEGRLLKIENGDHSYIELGPDRRAFINGIAEDIEGRILASTKSGVYEFAEAEAKWRDVGIRLKNDQLIEMIAAAADGLWIGTTAGAIHARDDGQSLYTTANGLPANIVRVIYTDRENSLWLGTVGGGLSNRANSAVVNYSAPALSKPQRISGDADGTIYVQTGCGSEPIRLVKIAGEQIVALPFPEARTEGSCRRNHFLHVATDRWWIMSSGLLSIFDGSRAPGGVPVTLPGGRKVDRFLEVYQDNARNLWLSTVDKNLYVAQAGDLDIPPRFEIAARDVGAILILRDSRGIVWLANNIFLGRLQNGEVNEIKNVDVVQSIQPRALFEDAKGRIWIGTRYEGVLYTDDPEAPTPSFKKITTADGLASNSIWAIAGDDSGGIYFGTGRGVDRYESEGGTLRHFTSADGVPESAVNHLFKDHLGRIWIASEAGVSRIDPAALDKDSRPPRVFISRITVAGEELALAESGVSDFATPALSANQNNVSVQFVAPSLKGERSLTYRYKLEGSEMDWSPASKQRDVTFANLGAGNYRFLVKAIDQRGVESESPAVLQFQILPPIWGRWWFLALVVIALGGIVYSLYRYRLAQVIELERVRTRIATDLHDDIGSNLTRIALMTEVLNQSGPNGSAKKMLHSIANIARESVASMNDIVWAISPEHDRVLDLTRRMRQHAEEVFTVRDIDVDFVSTSADSESRLAVGVRRDVLLIFKEAINNAARHSACTRVKIEFGRTSSHLCLRIADDGSGFSERAERDGHGLSSMARRASSLGGKLEVQSGPGEGTTVNFEMPL
jgi:ligand-binding sensor domain-containing protein/two-component sensor histidine kinase